MYKMYKIVREKNKNRFKNTPGFYRPAKSSWNAFQMTTMRYLETAPPPGTKTI